MITRIKRRDNEMVDFNQEKITAAIWKAAQSVGGTNKDLSKKLSDEVVEKLENKFPDQVIGVEDVQDMVEKVLIENGHSRTAKVYIL